MNYPSKETAKFFARQMNNYQMCLTDRISLTQFLSLFNVIGSGNAKKLDKLTQYLKKEASEYRYKEMMKKKAKQRLKTQNLTVASIERELRRSIADEYQKTRINLEKLKLVKLRHSECKQQQNDFMKHLRTSVTPSQRKLTGIVQENILKQKLMHGIHGCFQQRKESIQFTNRELSNSKNGKDELFY